MRVVRRKYSNYRLGLAPKETDWGIEAKLVEDTKRLKAYILVYPQVECILANDIMRFMTEDGEMVHSYRLVKIDNSRNDAFSWLILEHSDSCPKEAKEEEEKNV